MTLKLKADPPPPPPPPKPSAQSLAPPSAKRSAPAPVDVPRSSDDHDAARAEEADVIAQAQSRLARTINYFTDHPRLSAAAAVLVFVVLPLCYVIYSTYYSALLRTAANVSYNNGNYADAVRKLTEYSRISPGDLDSTLLLARAYMFNDGTRGASAVLDGLLRREPDDEQVMEANFYLALISMLEGDMERSSLYLRNISNRRSEYPPVSYVRGMQNLYGTANYATAAEHMRIALEQLEAIDDQDVRQRIDERIDFARRLWDNQYEDIVLVTPPLPFDALQDQLRYEAAPTVQDFPFILPTDAFYNIYYVPSNDRVMLEESMGAEENIRLLMAEASLRRREWDAAEERLSPLAQMKEAAGKQLSLKHLYFKAIFSIGKGDYSAAMGSYRLIDSRTGGAHAGLMLASARWGAGGGGAPGDEILEGYEEVLSQQPDSLPALVNKAYLHIVRNELEQATGPLEAATASHAGRFYVLYNTALLNLLQGNVFSAQDSLQQLLAAGTTSPAMTDVLTYALLVGGDGSGSGDSGDIVSAMQQLKTGERASPAVYLILADLYRKSERPVLVIAELVDGRKKFPDDKELFFDLLLEYARQGEWRQYFELKEVASAAELQGDYRAWMAEGLENGADVDVAEEAFQQALLNADTVTQKEIVLREWLRHMQRAVAPERGAVAAGHIDDVYAAGGAPSPDLRMLQIWGMAPGLNERERLNMIGEAVAWLDGGDKISPQETEDAAYALEALGDLREALRVLEPVAQVYGSQRSLQLVLRAYKNLGETDREKIEVTRRRLAAIAAKRNVDVGREQEQILRAAAAIQETGLAITRKGEQTSNSTALSGDDEYSSRLRLALEKQDYKKAVAIYSELLRGEHKGFTPALAHQNRGVLYLKMQEYDKAIADFVTAQEMEGLNESDRNNILYNHSLALLGNKDYAAARGILAELVEKTGGSMRNLVLYAQVLHGVKDYEAAVPVYEKLIRLSPEQAIFYAQLASAYSQLQRMDDAFDVVNAGLRISPSSPDLHRAIARLYAIIGDQEKAQEHLRVVRSNSN